MARLDDLLPEFKKDESSEKKVKENKETTLTGTKRRAWLANELKEDKPLKKEKENISSYISPPPENKINKVSSLKGSMNRVYRPKNLCFEDLRSNPLKLFQFLYELSSKKDFNYTTPRIKLREMMSNLDISKDSARTALRFLLKQKFINRIEFQPGQLGWSRYQLNEKTCSELENAILQGTASPFSFSNCKRNMEKTNLVNEHSIDPWEEVDVSLLECIGFNKKHLLQIKNKTSAELAQESINHFAYALKFNKKVQEYPNPLAALIAVLKRGEAWIEPDYQSPQELAQLKLLEIKKAEFERKKALEEELYKIALQEWQQKLNKEEIEAMAPDLRKRGDPVPPSAKLSLFFKENIWPEMKKDYLV